MNIYQEYAKAKLTIKLSQLKLKELEPKILEEVKHLSEPMKTESGTFTTVTREYWKYTKKVVDLEKSMKAKVEEEKKKEQEKGLAKKTEKVGLRFIDVKK